MNITEHEMRGLLNGKCLPGDMRVNEELPAYLVRKFAELKAQRDTLAAENAMLKSGIGFFSYGTDSGFEEHDSAEKAIAAAGSDIDYYRGDACDGWSEETDQTVWGVILQRATVTGLRAVTEDDNCDPSIKEWCDYTLLPNIETPATDAYLNSVRAEGLKMAIDHMNNQTSDDCADVTVLPVIEMYNQLRAGEPS